MVSMLTRDICSTAIALFLAILAPCVTASAASVKGDSHVLFSGELVPRLQIEIPPEGVKVLEAYRQVWGQPRPERVDVRATVREGDAVYTNVAVHLKGSYTFEPLNEKPSLTLNFDKFAEGQRFHDLDKIHLNNSVQDPSYLCEKLARELFTAAGIPASRAGHARVSINGRDTGFYLLVEGYNKRFLKRHFKSVKGNLYDGGSGGDITKALEVDSGENQEDRSDLTALAAAARDPNPATRLARLEKLLDVERFYTFAALEVLLLHWDGYCLGPNNFRLFHDTSTDKFVFLPHGMDQILGRGMALGTSLAPKWDGLVARAIFKSPDGRRRYLEHARETFTNYFQVAQLSQRLDEMAGQLQRSKALSLVEFAQMKVAAEDLKTRIERRAQLVQQQIQNPPRPVAINEGAPLSLTGWQLNRSTRTGATGRRVQTDGAETLEVRVTGGKWAAGSWRKTVLLGAGRYEFSGRSRTVGLGANPTNGVVLRLSGDLEIVGTNSPNWTVLKREFTVPGEVEEELVCEFRGPEGSGEFDLSSLKLRRLP